MKGRKGALKLGMAMRQQQILGHICANMANMRIDAHRKILTHGHWPYLIKTLSLSILILGVHCGFAALDINEKVITGIDGKNKVKSYGKKVERKTCRPMISFCE